MTTSFHPAMRLALSLALSLASALVVPGFALAQANDPNAPLATGQSSARPALIVAPRQPSAVVLPPIDLPEVSATLQARLAQLPAVRAIALMPDAPNVLRVISHNDMTIRLDTLVTRLNLAGVDRATEYERFANNVASFLARTDPFKPDQLRVVIRPTAAIDAFETETTINDVRNIVVRRPFMEGLEEVVVGDTPTSIAFMPAKRLIDLGLSAEEAFEKGRGNTISEVSAISWRPVPGRPATGLIEVVAPTGYDTSLMALDPAWTSSIETRLGGPVAVIIPTRDRIVIGRADRPRDIARLQAILTNEAKGNLALSTKIWVRRGEAWVTR